MRRSRCRSWMDPNDSHAVERAISKKAQPRLSGLSKTATEIDQRIDCTWQIQWIRDCEKGGMGGPIHLDCSPVSRGLYVRSIIIIRT